METGPTDVEEWEEGHTLDDLMEQMPGGYSSKKERELHSALLLAYYGAAYSAVSRGILATPLFSINYNHKKNRLRFDSTMGVAQVPRKGEYTVSSFDLIFACHARDMPLIFEGGTGVGKTVTTEAYLGAVLPKKGWVGMSLSHQSFTDSPKSHFERTEMEKGTPVLHLHEGHMRETGAMYIDELNLGNPNDLLQLSHGRVLISGERGVAGTTIPQVTKDGVKHEESEKKRLWLSGSQNPPKTKDAQFSGAELTASMKNRFLIIYYPGILKSVGTTLWLTGSEKNGLHKDFLEEFVKRYEDITGDSIDLDDLKKDWLDIYSYAMNSSRTKKRIIRSTLEFGDLLIDMFSGGMGQAYNTEKKIVEDWSKILPDRLTNSYVLSGDIQDTQEVKRIKQIVSSFGKPLTERDIDCIKDLADLFATIKSLKRAYAGGGDTLETYMRTTNYITVEDVAAAATLLAKNKQKDNTYDPVAVVNSVLKDYIGVLDELAEKMKFKKYSGFSTQNSGIGIKHAIYTASLRKVGSADDICKKIDHYMGMLRDLDAGSDIRKIIIARTMADLATAAGFIKGHEGKIDNYIQSGANVKGKAIREFVREIYETEARNPTIAAIYAHRLPRTL